MIETLLFNITRFASFLLMNDPSGIVGQPGQQAPGADAVTDTAANVAANGTGVIAGGAPAATEAAAGGGMWIMLVYAGVLIVAMYFLMFRGPKKREKKMKEMQASIRTGDNVVVTGGMFGRIADVGDDCFIVEFGQNRGIRIPVLKSDVLGVREPKLTPPPKVEAE